MSKKITFDTFIRGCLTVLGAAMAIYLINYLSSVLIPFFVAWLLAYLINPLVSFIQNKARIKNRVVSILIALVVLADFFIGAFMMIIPPMMAQAHKLINIANNYYNHLIDHHVLPSDLQAYVIQWVSSIGLTNKDYFTFAHDLIPQMISFFSATISFVSGMASAILTFLYLIFILIDYEKISNGWVKLVPIQHRGMLVELFDNVKAQMNSYFRGQSLIALIVGIMFAIGFTIIDFPLAIGLGLFIGLLNMVPYLQTVGIIPTVLLALLKAADTGDNFWIIMLQAAVVFAIVQTTQDTYLTPRIMGKQMGLNPAIILLSLSVWGALLGIIGLIIALPLTSLIKAYYERFIERNDRKHQLLNAAATPPAKEE